MRIELRGIWRLANYRLLWGAATISSFGSQVSRIAIPLLAAITLHASPLQMGVLAAAQNAAVPIFGLFAGVLADRRRRMPLLVFADLARAILLLSIPIVWWAGHLSVALLIVVSFTSGAFGVVFDVTRQSMIPTMVDREQLVDANGKIYLSETASDLVGPGLAGGMVQLLGAPVAILTDAVSYLASALLLVRMKLVEQITNSAPWSLRIIGREIADGYRTVMSIPILQRMSLSVAAGNLFENARDAVLILFMTRELGFSASLVGIVYAIGGAGFFIGALLPGVAANRLGLGRAITTGLLILWLADVMFPLAGGPKLAAAAMLGAAMFTFGIGGSIFDVNQFSLRQAVTPDPVRGRANATIRVLVRGIAPVGALIGGLIAEAYGLRAALIFAAFSSPASLLILVGSDIPKLKTMPSSG